MADAIREIDPEGDVVLVVGRAKEKLKVSSTTLSKASPVFKALFGPHFREGQAERTSADPVEVSLPDDAAWAMTWICEHLHNAQVPDEEKHAYLSVQIMRIAMLVDKYDLASVLRLHMRAVLLAWILDYREDCTIFNTSNIIAASYLVHQARAFQMVTHLFVERKFVNLSMLLQQESGKLYPTSVLLALEERRASGSTDLKGLCLRCAKEGAYLGGSCSKHIPF